MTACQAHPPPNWVQGGSPLDIPRARWTRGKQVIDIMPDGKVLTDGEHTFTIDRGGRIYDTDNDAIAVLQVDGRLLGKDEIVLGKVGVHNASPPGREIAWLSVGDQGDVVHFDPDGNQQSDGAWAGCGAAVRACTLTTHMQTLVESRRARGGPGFAGPTIGIGVGFGMVVAP
jgi:hypothetical protein